MCIYYRRFKHSPMLQKEKTCIKTRGVKTFEPNEDVYIFLILPKYVILFKCIYIYKHILCEISYSGGH